MMPRPLREKLIQEIAAAENPREKAVDVFLQFQEHNGGYMSDEAMQEAAELLAMTPLEVEELATFYDFVYREPVGKYVIRVCDSTICWMHGHQSLIDHLCARLDIEIGGTTSDKLFTLLPVCCIGYCDFAPAIMINKKVYGNLTIEKIDTLIQKLVDRERSGEQER
jgi:NADH-quinone oxidoreductase subunit E